MHGYVQVVWHFLSPVGARKNMVNEQNICLYSMLSHQIRVYYLTVISFSNISASSFLKYFISGPYLSHICL